MEIQLFPIVRNGIFKDDKQHNLDLEKKMYSVPVYNFENLDVIPDQNIQLTINDSQFLEVLLLKLRGETIKYASGLKRGKIMMKNNLFQKYKL